MVQEVIINYCRAMQQAIAKNTCKYLTIVLCMYIYICIRAHMYINAHNTPMFVCTLNVNRDFGLKTEEKKLCACVCVCVG